MRIKAILSPKRVLTRAVNGHVLLWRSMFWQTWEPLGLDEKLSWIVFISQTIGIITLIEYIFLKI